MSSDSYNSENTNDSETVADDREFDYTYEDKMHTCKAFALLDVDGDGVIEPPDLKKLLISWGRMPMGDDYDEIMSHADGVGCEGAEGMDYENFETYIQAQLKDTKNEEELRDAFKVFDIDPPSGRINMTELRHHLKHTGLKLTDDEIDHLFKEEDYWMLEEKNIFDYEQLIRKLLDKPTCNSPFLNCQGQH